MKKSTGIPNAAAAETPAPDGFVCSKDDPLFAEHQLLTRILWENQDFGNALQHRQGMPSNIEGEIVIYQGDEAMSRGSAGDSASIDR